jgi:hypothetical protein
MVNCSSSASRSLSRRLLGTCAATRGHHLKAGARFSPTMPTSRRSTFCPANDRVPDPLLSCHHTAWTTNLAVVWRDGKPRLRSGSRTRSPGLSHGTRRRDTSFGIGTPRTGQSLCSVCAPWAFEIGRLRSATICCSLAAPTTRAEATSGVARRIAAPRSGDRRHAVPLPRAAFRGGRHHLVMVGGIIPLRRATSSRNGGRLGQEPAIIITREPTFRSRRMLPTRPITSNASEMLLHIRSLADYTTDTHETNFWKRQPLLARGYSTICIGVGR